MCKSVFLKGSDCKKQLLNFLVPMFLWLWYNYEIGHVQAVLRLWLMAECVVYYCFLYEWHVVHFPLYYYVYAHEFLLFSCPVLYESLLMQRTRLPSLSPSPGACSNSRPSNQCILCCPLLFLHSVFPSIRVFSNELGLPIRWPKHWSFSFSINPLLYVKQIKNKVLPIAQRTIFNIL